MKKLLFTLVTLVAVISSCPLFGQEIQEEVLFTTVKDFVETQEDGWFRVQGKYVKTYDKSKLLFSIEDEDYIIPVRLVKKDLGAEGRFQALNLQKGDMLLVEGRLTNLEVGWLEFYKGLADAVILEKKESEDVPASSETMPSFNGGDTREFSKWVNSQLKYPKTAKENGIQGRVTLSFTVGKDGSVTNVKVLKGVEPTIDEEAVRVVSMSPKWTPGTLNGQPVAVTYTFPVNFGLHLE